jgi:ABC-2 type transport system ATP-binding protein
MSAAAEPTIVGRRRLEVVRRVVAVNGVSLVVEPGVTALLGPNGAGKTTLLRTIAGLISPSQGAVTVFGEAPRNNPELYRRIGYMPEHEGVYDFLTGRQFVELCARLEQVPDPAAVSLRAIEIVDLVAAQDRRCAATRAGCGQRMRLAATLVHDPPLLLLDEPLSGTDPAQRLHLGNVIRRLGAEGRTVLVSSHILEEVEELADRIHLMVGGKLAASGDFRAIRQQLERPPVRRAAIDGRATRRAARRRGCLEAGGRASRSRSTRQGPPARSPEQRRGAAQRSLPARRAAASTSGLPARREPARRLSLESVFEYLAQGS